MASYIQEVHICTYLQVITRSTTCDKNQRTRWSRPIVYYPLPCHLCPTIGPEGLQDCRFGLEPRGERTSFEANAGWLS